jgi:hypothetical protein
LFFPAASFAGAKFFWRLLLLAPILASAYFFGAYFFPAPIFPGAYFSWLLATSGKHRQPELSVTSVALGEKDHYHRAC